MQNLYRIINFKQNCGSCGGSLVQFQEGDADVNALPFLIGKVLVSSGMKPDDVRGNHAHHGTEEIVVALSGGCTFELDDGRGTRESVRLSASEVRDQKSEVSERTPIEFEQSSKIKDQKSGDEKVISDLRPLTSYKAALLLYPHIWRTLHGFEPGTVLLVVANMKYDETDYIRDRAEFERLSATWPGLGGSASR